MDTILGNTDKLSSGFDRKISDETDVSSSPFVAISYAPMRIHQVLKANIDALLRKQGAHRKDLAMWCWNRSESWISKIMRNPNKGFSWKYLDRIADFFGRDTYELFQPGLSEETERRRGTDRRKGQERRVGHQAQLKAATLATQIDAARPRRRGQPASDKH